ncbi:putative Matrix metalloproteinase-16 [Hypsibius exemplaris]|uniref:Matrix metalloproteinase-16 n=1 Tax=Hypsibius exemplaris TaxID=2072580 RepID=A0A9X6RNY5_HYPEX|nr:putative Matrix metalloproteinase-16 [Hypsibius exemplaris]
MILNDHAKRLSAVLFVSWGVSVAVVSTAPSADEAFVADYLRKYGYIDGPSLRSAGQITMATAIKKFQNFAGLDETGLLDDPTLAKMVQPRCGVKDITTGGVGRRKRQVLDFGKWQQNQLTYRMAGRPGRMHPEVVDSEIRKAFGMWSTVANVTLRQVPDQQDADMEIAFVKGDHGDHEPFDGPKGMLGHAFFPPFGGNTHFDDSEDWTAESPHGVNLFQVATHEFGHALGLGHSRNPRALMAPFYQPFTRNFSLQNEDVTQIQKLYGQRLVAASSDDAPSNSINPFGTIESITGRPVETATQIVPPGTDLPATERRPSPSSPTRKTRRTTRQPLKCLRSKPDGTRTVGWYPNGGGGYRTVGVDRTVGWVPKRWGWVPKRWGGANGIPFGVQGPLTQYGFNGGFTGGATQSYGYQQPYYPNGQVPLYPIYPTYQVIVGTPTTTAAPTTTTTTTTAAPIYYYPPFNPYTSYGPNYNSYPSYNSYPQYPSYNQYPSYPGPYAPGFGGFNVIVGTPTTTAASTTTTTTTTKTPAPIIIYVGTPNGYGNGANYGGGNYGGGYGGGYNGYNGYRGGNTYGAGTFTGVPPFGVGYGGFVPSGAGPVQVLRATTTLGVTLADDGVSPVEDPNGDPTGPSVVRPVTETVDQVVKPKIVDEENRFVDGPSDGNDVNNRADLCGVETPDAVVTTGNGNLLVFKDSKFWTLDKTFRANAARSTTELGPSLTHVDAAYFKQPNIFLFSGEKYYKFSVDGNEMTPATDYPRLISQGYPGIPNSPVDEIIRRGNRLWFFHGLNVTVYNPEKFPPIDAANGYMDIRELEGFPEHVTAAVVDETDPKGSFVFEAGAAFKLSKSEEKLRSRTARSSPRTFREWLRCGTLKT